MVGGAAGQREPERTMEFVRKAGVPTCGSIPSCENNKADHPPAYFGCTVTRLRIIAAET
jgi:hypothetical protein